MSLRRTPLLLAAALLAGTVVPARATWVCPDGTPCALDAVRGFICAGERCGVGPSCCEQAGPVPCDHNARELSTTDSSHVHLVGAAGHCRLSVVGGSSSAAAPARPGPPDAQSADAAMESPVDPTSASALPALRSHRRQDECRPPPFLEAGPARAPPVS